MPAPRATRSRLLAAVALTALTLTLTAAAPAAVMEAETDAEMCAHFARASLAVQTELAAKVCALNGRRVYVFDATGFSAGWRDARTDDGVRYKTGVLEDRAADAVLSASAQRTLCGAPGARTFLSWTDKHGLTVDQHGVYYEA